MDSSPKKATQTPAGGRGATNKVAAAKTSSPPPHDLASKLKALAVVGALIVALLPVFVSELAGGWTKKYTSTFPGPPYTTDRIPALWGKVAIVTGANTGIGYQTALELVLHGAEVVVACRDGAKANEAVSRIVNAVADAIPEAKEVRVKPMRLDLSSLASVRRFARDFQKLRIPLHILVLNAGIMKSTGAQFVGRNFTYGFDVTKDGLESHMGVNHVAHHYLATLLIPELQKGAKSATESGGGGSSRVILVSSTASESGGYPEGVRFDLWKPPGGNINNGRIAPPGDYEDGRAYAQSKLANVLFAREFAERMEKDGHLDITAYSCHPGIVRSELHRYLEEEAKREEEEAPHLSSLVERWKDRFMNAVYDQARMSVADGALTQLHLASAPAGELVNGGFYHPIGRLVDHSHPQAKNATLQRVLWEKTEETIRGIFDAMKEAKENVVAGDSRVTVKGRETAAFVNSSSTGYHIALSEH